jgi:outer membrane biosynthesis protein TonB
MGRLSASLLVLALGLAAAMALSACGSSGNAKLLPGATASQITSNLDQVQELVGEGECIGAQNAAAAVSEQIEELNGVDTKLKQALSEGANRLNEVVSSCEEAGPSEAEEEAEEQEALETIENEEAEKTEKPAKEKNKPEDKPEKEAQEPKEAKEPPVEPEPPAQEEESEAPPAEPGGGAGAGGVGPGAPAGEG